MGQKFGGVGVPFFSGGSWVPIEHKVAWAEAYPIPSGILVHPAVWPQRTLAENWGACPFRGGELGPHLRQCRLAEAYSVPSGILIHAAIWPQQIWAKNWRGL